MAFAYSARFKRDTPLKPGFGADARRGVEPLLERRGEAVERGAVGPRLAGRRHEARAHLAHGVLPHVSTIAERHRASRRRARGRPRARRSCGSRRSSDRARPRGSAAAALWCTARRSRRPAAASNPAMRMRLAGDRIVLLELHVEAELIAPAVLIVQAANGPPAHRSACRPTTR